jgi:hypothetical protein
MKKFIVPCVLAIALVIPAQASAKTKRYAGPVSPTGTVSFTVKNSKKNKKKKFLGDFTFTGVPVNCDDGAHTASGSFGNPYKVKGGAFNIVGSNPSRGFAWEIHGTLSGGSLSVSGSLPLDGGGTGSNCSTGVLSWTSARA